MQLKNILRSFKNQVMLKNVLIVLGLLIAYRFMAHVPVPLGDPTTFKEAIEALIGKSDFGNFINLVSGGTLSSLSIVFVGISPYITASIVIQLIVKAFPKLEELSQDGESGQRKINQWTRLVSVPMTLIQSTGFMFIMYKTYIASNTGVVMEPSFADWVLSATSMTAGSVILMWLGELITEQGIGNGISMIIFTSILSQISSNIFGLVSAMMNTADGTLSLFGWLELPVNPKAFFLTIGIGILTVSIIYFLVKLNEAQRIITINYAKRVHGNSSYGGIKSILPLKLISAGVIPVIFATAILSLPAMAGQIITMNDPTSEFAHTLTSMFTAPSAHNFAQKYPNGITPEWFFYPTFFFVLVFAFTYFYTSSVMFNSKEIADNIQKQGGFIEKVRPGIKTAEYLQSVVNRLNLFGALSLGFVALIPFILDYISIAISGVPLGLSISGTGLLIVISVALESLRQLDSRALMITYDNYK